MLAKIKQLADEAISLQNKNRMDEVLREISALCGQPEPEDVKAEELKVDTAEEKPRKGGKNAK